MNRAENGLRRVIALLVHPNEVRALLQDDFHHFRIVLHHDSTIITGVSGDALHYPYSLCPAAIGALDELIGLPLSRRVFDISSVIDARQQCTHQFDLAALAAAAASRRQSRRYEMFVTDQVHGRCTAQLDRDDGYSLHWEIHGRVIEGPSAFAGVSVDHGFTDWAASLPSEDEAEAALVLRRAHFVTRGRRLLRELNASISAEARSSCYAMQPKRASKALRIPSTLQDGTAPLVISSDDENWLNGA